MADVSVNVPHLTEQYHKARKGYALASGLLIAWELVGIELTETPLVSVNARLLTPSAAPYILIAVTLYFAMRTGLEWYQVDRGRRSMLAARLDFTVANTIGVGALALFSVQRVSNVQLAAVDGGILLGFLVIGFVWAVFAAWASVTIEGEFTKRGRPVPFQKQLSEEQYMALFCFVGAAAIASVIYVPLHWFWHGTAALPTGKFSVATTATSAFVVGALATHGVIALTLWLVEQNSAPIPPRPTRPQPQVRTP